MLYNQRSDALYRVSAGFGESSERMRSQILAPRVYRGASLEILQELSVRAVGERDEVANESLCL
ncbi:MAG: hypothetical protein UY39_C0004G0001 [Candidatus Kaiserbacteria bacterium GW2011_GWC2_49_12]|uniref:Uncharacterized protein n=3 Tax=Candidatus Kaiseribacteriota TaxID=1752734 RepID=A0A0G1ZE73_9BACT|nr:MAG: hypothetical protein UY39_C0004G0001 [Candidatus Kaiserbacteria bacterium GW2011_GWC2_49_12]KKW17514.1 MAG: hypothetical protein UY57_C0016G0020 [Candidatus Kaiserbacteria bacterium GW2011_GWB1_50_17]KKW18618.1 MAG: hypothetical protein UY59_C0002G0013 [Candidatus Kaiserbacteria bacterium GW2011_GWA1_50_28]